MSDHANPSLSPLLYSAHMFLEEFFEGAGPSSRLLSTEESLHGLRKTCLAGFMSLDCALSAYWKEVIVPDWNNLLGHCNELLDDDAAIDQMVEDMSGALTRGQLIASLRFLENTGDPERFSPSLMDCGLVFAMLQDKGKVLPFMELAQKLCRGQKLRNAVFHTGKVFSEIEAATSIKVLKEIFLLMPKLNPVFRDAFESSPVPKEKAA